MRNKKKIYVDRKNESDLKGEEYEFFLERKKDYLIELDSNIIRFLFCFVDG